MNQLFSIIAVTTLHSHIWFFIALKLKKNDLADVAWGGNFAVAAITSFLLGPQNNIQLLITLLVLVWATRLSIHIYLRNRHKKEDYRYQDMRSKWGSDQIIKSYTNVFLLQTLLALIVVSPVILTNLQNEYQLNIFILLGLFVWTIGFFTETIADIQLTNFKNNQSNHGKIITSGLWKYSRHPNYFGEVLCWWGIFILSLGSPFALFTIIGPLLITLLITKVSGIPLLEKKYENNPEYQKYQKKVSPFFPLPPKA